MFPSREAIPLIRPDLWYTEIVNYYWNVPLKRSHPSYQARFMIHWDSKLLLSSFYAHFWSPSPCVWRFLTYCDVYLQKWLRNRLDKKWNHNLASILGNFIYTGVALAPKILEPKKSPILIFCRQFSNIEAKLWFHFLSSRFLSHFCKCFACLYMEDDVFLLYICKLFIALMTIIFICSNVWHSSSRTIVHFMLIFGTINITRSSKKTPKQSISYDFVAVSLARITV
jgi:hypothetical protein